MPPYYKTFQRNCRPAIYARLNGAFRTYELLAGRILKHFGKLTEQAIPYTALLAILPGQSTRYIIATHAQTLQ